MQSGMPKEIKASLHSFSTAFPSFAFSDLIGHRSIKAGKKQALHLKTKKAFLKSRALDYDG